MKIMITDRALKAMRPAAAGKRKLVWDAAVPGFGVAVTDKGTVSFIIMRRWPGHKHASSIKLGAYPVMSLAAARAAALEALRDLAQGIDPRAKREAAAAARAAQAASTFGAIAEQFIARHVRKLKSATEYEATIHRELISRWHNKPIAEISRRDVIALLSDHANTGKLYAAHKIHNIVTKLFNWALARGIIDASPCVSIKPNEIIGPKQQRHRVLADVEVKILWQALDGLGYPTAPFVRMLLLTGQRLREVANMTWSEVDLDHALWTVPRERMKGGAAHEVPLAPYVVEMLKDLPRFVAGNYIFTTTSGKRPISGFSKMKERTDRATPQIAPWRFHDLRRTMRTGLGGLPVPVNVAELCLAHAQPGLHAVYDRHSYREEKRRAMELWSARVIDIVAEHPADNVVSIARG